MESTLPIRHTAKLPEVEIRGAVVAINSCPVCRGSQQCERCGGSGGVKNPDGPGWWRCVVCDESGRCFHCEDHCLSMLRFASDLKRGSFAVAEARLQRALAEAEREREGVGSTLGVAGAVGGTVLGTILAPGLGTIVGLSVGRMLGDRLAQCEDLSSSHWKHADLFYSLGVLYAAQGRHAESQQAWIKSLTLNDRHRAARNALEERL